MYTKNLGRSDIVSHTSLLLRILQSFQTSAERISDLFQAATVLIYLLLKRKSDIVVDTTV